MKQILVVAITLIAPFISLGQEIRTTTHFGFSSILKENYNQSVNPVVFVGIEFGEKFGIEYGNSFHISKDLFNVEYFVNGTSQKHYVGSTADFYSIYLMTKIEDGARFNLGLGFADLKDYSLVNPQNPTTKIQKSFVPFVKTSLNNKVSNRINWTLNANLSLDVFSFTTGVSYKF